MDSLSKQYPVWLCDVWGVVHDGHKPIPAAVNALVRHRQQGGRVIFITNAPRPKAEIQHHLDGIGIARAAYDDMVTSGDVTRHLMVDLGRRGLFHLGPEWDSSLFAGLEVKRVGLEQSGAVICTGFLDETREVSSDYHPLFARMRALDLTMICANPDKVVRKGDVLVPCAGAIAEEYEKLGGKIVMAGKPYAPIYEAALKLAGVTDKSGVLAIGDGPDTDVKGALANGLPCVFISGGINQGEDPHADVQARYPAAQILRAMPELYWG